MSCPVRRADDFARPRCGSAQWRALVLGALAAWLPTVGTPAAVPQQPAAATVDSPLRRLVQADAQRLVTSPDAAVRGEAALLLAASGEARHYPAVLAVAREPDPEAHLRGLVALGLLAAPGAEFHLEQVLDASQTRVQPAGTAAALGIGLLPEAAAGAVGRYLARFQRSSYRRQRDALLAMLAGLGTAAQPSCALALQTLLRDDANRDDELRIRLVTVLGGTPHGLPTGLSADLLDRGGAAVRSAILQALAATAEPGGEPDPALLERIVRLQEHDASAEVRAAALLWLTAWRHLPALERAAVAVRSSHPPEAAQGVRSALALAGGAMRRALEPVILAEERPALRAALLAAFDPPFGEELAAACRRQAADRRLPLPLRTASALALGRAGDINAAPLLRDLFQENDDAEALEAVARALLRLEPDAPELDRLAPGGRTGELLRTPQRLRALLLAGHGGAARFALQQLAATDTTPAVQVAVLAALRQALFPERSLPASGLLPAPLRGVLR